MNVSKIPTVLYFFKIQNPSQKVFTLYIAVGNLPSVIIIKNGAFFFFFFFFFFLISFVVQYVSLFQTFFFLKYKFPNSLSIFVLIVCLFLHCYVLFVFVYSIHCFMYICVDFTEQISMNQ